MPPITVRGIGIESKGDHVIATFTLSEPPSQAWIAFFRERANGSLLNIQAATVRRNRLAIDLLDQEDLERLVRSVEAIVEGSNYDVQFQLPSR